MTKEERLAAFKNYRVEIMEGRIYAVVAIDFGRKPHEIHFQDMYQRLTSATDTTIRKYWYGTTLAADHKHDEREARMKMAWEARRG